MAKLVINGGGNDNRRYITDMEAGEVFSFTGSSKGNNGTCLRLKDSKNGRGRFVHLETGKVLIASDYDRGTPVDARLTV